MHLKEFLNDYVGVNFVESFAIVNSEEVGVSGLLSLAQHKLDKVHQIVTSGSTFPVAELTGVK